MKSYFFAPVCDPDSTACSLSSMHRLLKTNEKKQKSSPKRPLLPGFEVMQRLCDWQCRSTQDFFKVKALFLVSLSLHTTTVAGYVTNVV